MRQLVKDYGNTIKIPNEGAGTKKQFKDIVFNVLERSFKGSTRHRGLGRL